MIVNAQIRQPSGSFCGNVKYLFFQIGSLTTVKSKVPQRGHTSKTERRCVEAHAIAH